MFDPATWFCIGIVALVLVIIKLWNRDGDE
jgi:hypothetical protein